MEDEEIKTYEVIVDEDVVIEKLNKYKYSGDNEEAHIEADKILCDFLIELGFEKVVYAYNEIDKWYS